MTETTDGFEIAERDLALRGPGDFFGTRQAGVPTFRVDRSGARRELLDRRRRSERLVRLRRADAGGAGGAARRVEQRFRRCIESLRRSAVRSRSIAAVSESGEAGADARQRISSELRTTAGSKCRGCGFHNDTMFDPVSLLTTWMGNRPCFEKEMDCARFARRQPRRRGSESGLTRRAGRRSARPLARSGDLRALPEGRSRAPERARRAVQGSGVHGGRRAHRVVHEEWARGRAGSRRGGTLSERRARARGGCRRSDRRDRRSVGSAGISGTT